MWHTLYVVVCGISWDVVGVGCVRGWVRGLRQGVLFLHGVLPGGVPIFWVRTTMGVCCLLFL